MIYKKSDNLQVTEHMMKSWTSPIYAFYEPIPIITYVDGRRCHVFKCAARGCKFTSRRYLDTKDKSLTGNLVRHAKGCWGEECWAAAGACHTAQEARESVTKPYNQSGSITASFSRTGKGKVTYSHRTHTKTETKYVPTLFATIPALTPHVKGLR